MKIRSITYFLNPGWPLKQDTIEKAGIFQREAIEIFTLSGFDVQTTRMAIVPFPYLMKTQVLEECVSFSQELELEARKIGFDYVSIGAAFPEQLEYYPYIYEILNATDYVFVSASMTTRLGQVSLPAIKACADIIEKSSRITNDGFGNLYFAALANVPAGIPFFPAAYHHYSDESDQPEFSLALEAADVVNDAIYGAKHLAEVQEVLKARIELEANNLSRLASVLSKKTGCSFGGIDFTPAPYPVRETSLGTALELLGVKTVGLHGSLAASAFLTDAIDKAHYKRAGFNGLFFPVLEDKALADSTALGALGLKDLLLYSTVCGAGLDTIPLPGNIGIDRLYAILLDVAFLAVRLDKPLTARLMPIPGKDAGEVTDFHFNYFANSRVMPVQANSILGLLGSDEVLNINSSGNKER